ncbi:MAG: class I SAM-dependent methyltransferase [Deltaproteobacteria bacterium]|nr:class I SAM-dependent methyltransferase [Deltaproteobacteria bacterium]
MALAGLDPMSCSRLTGEIYSSRGDYSAEGLFDWERSWLESDLCPPPARVLIGGAGTGRELVHLARAGYELVAFDPAPAFVRKAAQRLQTPACLTFLEGGYEALAQPDTRGQLRFAQSIRAHAPYDGVLLGWGSLTHVAGEEQRRRLLIALRALCPRGPILASVWMRGDDTEIHRSRAFRLGWEIGRRLHPGAPARTRPHPGDHVISRAGFGHYFTRAEIHALAEATGHRLTREPPGPYSGVFPHFTLMPAEARPE